MKKNFIILIALFAGIAQTTNSAPLGLFEPYDINIKLKKPAPKNFYFGVMGEKSYDVKGYATDIREEETFQVNPLQIYEPQQNIIGLYQGTDIGESAFLNLLDGIAGGSGGGVNNLENGLYTPTGEFSAGQASLSGIYGIKHNFFASVHVPFYFVELRNVNWKYTGNSNLFSGEQIQQLVTSFEQDARNLFGLNTSGWKKQGIGDVTCMLEWQEDFLQRRPVLKSVQANVRAGISIPTGCNADESVIMPVAFGSDGPVSIPFGGGLGLNLANHAEIGFSGQFWYHWKYQKERRIKTFATQTSLLFPTVTPAIKDHAFIQSFNLYGQLFSPCKRFALKMCYQYWRKGEDFITPIDPKYNITFVNSAEQLNERTEHNVVASLSYSPRANDFKRIIPQAQIFWKGSVKGTRAALVSSAGAQLSLIF